MNNAHLSANPVVTVVIPTYNRLLLVREAIRSVLAQTYAHWELIVADDGSTDDTVKIMRSIQDPRIRILELPHCGNIAAVRNAGAAAGSGPWIAFLDSDDLWVPEKLTHQLSLLEREGKRWSYGGFELIDDSGQPLPFKAGNYTPHSGWIAAALLTSEASVNIGTLMVDRTLFNEVGGLDTEPLLNYREDYDFALRLALQAETAASPELLMRVREHQGRVTNGFAHGNERTAYAYRHFIGRAPGDQLERIARRHMAYHLAEAAAKNMQNGRGLRALRQFTQALWSGDSWRHLISALRRGIRGRGVSSAAGAYHKH